MLANPPNPTTPILDDFTRADQGPAPSSSWTNGVTTFVASTGLVVKSNQLTRDATANFRVGSYWNAATFGPAQEVYCTLQPSGLVSGDEFDMHLMLTSIGSGTTTGYACAINQQGNWTLTRLVPGSGIGIGTALQTATPAAGDKAWLLYVSNKLYLYRLPAGNQSWVLMAYAFDTVNPPTNGNIGIEIATANQHWNIDDFGGGTVSPPDVAPPSNRPLIYMRKNR